MGNGWLSVFLLANDAAPAASLDYRMLEKTCGVPQVSPLRPGKLRTAFRNLVLAALLASGLSVPAQTADQAWLRYSGYHGPTAIPLKVRALGHGILEQSAAQELQR